MSIDSQVTELIGRNRLVDELLRAGVEVAVPQRDRGVDLVAYPDADSRATSFIARPIQIKASSKEQFSIDRKYARIRDLILAFVWHIHDQARTVTYAVTYPEALAIGRAMGWAKTLSWVRNGKYTTQRPSKKLVGLLQPHRMTADLWRRKVMGSRI